MSQRDPYVVAVQKPFTGGSRSCVHERAASGERAANTCADDADYEMGIFVSSSSDAAAVYGCRHPCTLENWVLGRVN